MIYCDGRENEMKWLKTILLLQAFAVVALITVGALVYSAFTSRPNLPANVIPTPTAEQINGAVARLIASGRASDLYSFYAMEVGDPIKASLYIYAALTNGVPVDKIMSVGWYEGGYKINIVDGPNENGSYDVRPQGLNTMTYKMYTVAELKMLEHNIPLSGQHLADSNDKWNVSWEGALTVYNHGTPTNLDQRQIDYVSAVLRHEWELDRRFVARFPDSILWANP
jgi:hypothetical protein